MNSDDSGESDQVFREILAQGRNNRISFWRPPLRIYLTLEAMEADLDGRTDEQP